MRRETPTQIITTNFYQINARSLPPSNFLQLPQIIDTSYRISEVKKLYGFEIMHPSGGASMRRRSFRDSIKMLEADIQHANTLASDFPREYDGVSLKMRISYSPAAHFFLFLVQWTDCRLAGALGLLRILIYKMHTIPDYFIQLVMKSWYRYMLMAPPLCLLTREKRALENSMSDVSDSEDRKHKVVCMERYRRRDEEKHERCLEVNSEGEEDCRICMEIRSKVLLPNCNHEMCLKCYREWHSRSQSCPFCRDSLKRINSGDLWISLNGNDVIDMAAITSDNLKRLYTFVDKLPLIVPDTLFAAYNRHSRYLTICGGSILFRLHSQSLESYLSSSFHSELHSQSPESYKSSSFHSEGFY